VIVLPDNAIAGAVLPTIVRVVELVHNEDLAGIEAEADLMTSPALATVESTRLGEIPGLNPDDLPLPTV
jgi:hypothetical protein